MKREKGEKGKRGKGEKGKRVKSKRELKLNIFGMVGYLQDGYATELSHNII